MQLSIDTFLQRGKYRILQVLGQGGFGITYLAMQSGLERMVAIKEFFIKELCWRDEITNYVTPGTEGSRETVERFREKFLKEARKLASLNHPYIVRVIDVFEENGTAYYVMEYAPNGSLADKVKQRGSLTESEATRYILQVAEALNHIHQRKMNHLDIKPDNIIINEKDEAILVDFGLSKQYDITTGAQTSTTPVGFSVGYAPLEQYRPGGVSAFSPETDIYSLGATFFNLLTGLTPPNASDIIEDGVPVEELQLKGIGKNTIDVISKSMVGRRKERMRDVTCFIKGLSNSIDHNFTQRACGIVEETRVNKGHFDYYKTIAYNSITEDKDRFFLKNYLWYILLCLVGVAVAVITSFLWNSWGSSNEVSSSIIITSDTIDENNKDTILILKSNEQKRATNLLYVKTLPIEAMVYVDGEIIGSSPIEGIEISSGNHHVKIIKDGYKPFSQNYFFDRDSIVIEETLVAIPASTPIKQKPSNPTKPSVTGFNNGHEYVDLGLSVMWATKNIGESYPDDSCQYFAWGEIQSKSSYTEDNCSTYDKEIGSISGNITYDAARYHWGGSWRLPTKNEMEELLNKCHWSLVSQDNYTGYKVTGPNGQSIFFTAMGNRNSKSTSTRNVRDYGYYWCGSPYENNTKAAYSMFFYHGGRSVNGFNRSLGLSIRPVLDLASTTEKSDIKTIKQQNGSDTANLLMREPKLTYEWIDLGLPSGTLWAKCNIGAKDEYDPGMYLAWGETTPKSRYTQDTYFDRFSEIFNYSKNRSLIGTKYDAATEHWGSGCVMPTREQAIELYKSCKWTWKNNYMSSGISGCICTGPNGNEIFLPAGGLIMGEEHRCENRGNIWIGTLNFFNNFEWAFFIDFDEKGPFFRMVPYENTYTFVSQDFRWWGRNVRAVKNRKN